MPGRGRSNKSASREAESGERVRMKSRRKAEPSLNDLRRKLVGNKRELLKKFAVTVCAISASWVVASHVHLQQLARDYPAATDNSRAAMSALATNARDAAGNVYAEAGSILHGGHLTAVKSVASAAPHEGHRGGAIASAAHARKLALAATARRHAALHEHMHRGHRQSVAAATVSAGVMDGDWTFDDFTTQLGNEIDKAESMLFNFGYNTIELNWAPGLRDWLSGEIQSATASFAGNGSFRVNGLSSLTQTLFSSRGLLAAGAGLMMFLLMISLSGWLRRSRRDVNSSSYIEY